MNTCLNCNKECKSTYCDTRCQIDFQYKKYIERWKRGLEKGTRGLQVSNHIRRYMIEKTNGKCSKCGWGEVNPYTKRTPLEINHIDGNSKNNIEINLEILCPNCHSLTDSYREFPRKPRPLAARMNWKNKFKIT